MTSGLQRRYQRPVARPENSRNERWSGRACLLILGVGLLYLPGCPDADPGPASQDAVAAPDSEASGAAATPDAAAPRAPAPPPPLPFAIDDDKLDVVAAWSVDPEDGELDGLERTARPWAVPLEGSIRIELWQRLSDFRVRLLDGKGKILGSEVLVGQVLTRRRGDEVEPGGTWIQVHPKKGFPPSTPIRIVFDGESGPYLLDLKGQPYQDLVLDVVGDTPPATLEPAGDGGTRPIGSEELP